MKAPVKAISESGQVAGGVFGVFERVVGAAEAAFEVTPEGVESTELGYLMRFAQADDDGLVVTPRGRHPSKAGQPIGKDLAAGGQGDFSPVRQGGAGEPRDRDHFGVERMALGSEGNRCDKRNLVFGTPPNFAAHPFTAQVRVIDQHLATQGVLGITLGHRLHQFVLN